MALTSAYRFSYSCFSDHGSSEGVCRQTGYPTYRYRVYVDYGDGMALKVAAVTADNDNMPGYVCAIYGWLTPVEVTLECNTTAVSDIMPPTLYCSANRYMAICVED